jgi:hypothetical protein
MKNQDLFIKSFLFELDITFFGGISHFPWFFLAVVTSSTSVLTFNPRERSKSIAHLNDM